MENVGVLSNNVKSILNQNLGELSAIDGNLISAAEGKEIRSILVTSCNPREGKTIAALSMAYSLSTETSSRVLLVDGNMNSPKIHELFNVQVSPGLSNFLVADNQYEEAVRKTEYDNLLVMPHGSAVSAAMLDMFSLKKVKDKVKYLRDQNDYLIFDSPSVSSSSDASVLGRYFDGIILVVECEKTRWEVVQMAKEKLTRAGGKLLGVILNKRKYYIPKTLYGRG